MNHPRLTRRGYTLIEVLVATVILGFVAVGTAGVLIGGAQRSRDAAALGYRAAILQAEVSRITAAAPGALADGNTSTTVATQPFPYTLTTSIVTSGSIQSVTITVMPIGPQAIEPVTRTLSRNLLGSSPFSP